MRIDPMPTDAYDRGYHTTITIEPLQEDFLIDNLVQKWKHHPLQIEDLDNLDYDRVIFDLKKRRLKMKSLFQMIKAGAVDIMEFTGDGYYFGSVGAKSSWKNFNAFEARDISEHLGFTMMGLDRYLQLQQDQELGIDRDGGTWLKEFNELDTFPEYSKVHKGEQLRGYFNKYNDELVIDSYDPHYYGSYLGFRGELFVPSST